MLVGARTYSVVFIELSFILEWVVNVPYEKSKKPFSVLIENNIVRNGFIGKIRNPVMNRIKLVFFLIRFTDKTINHSQSNFIHKINY